MQPYGVLILFLTLTTAFGLRCYSCATSTSEPCTTILKCEAPFDRCSSVELHGVVTKSCMSSVLCKSPVKCCEKNLCNGAMPAGSSVLLLLVSAAITTVFL